VIMLVGLKDLKHLYDYTVSEPGRSHSTCNKFIFMLKIFMHG
jgi:hypothetical protein